jgi:hypothetical protein
MVEVLKIRFGVVHMPLQEIVTVPGNVTLKIKEIGRVVH